MKICIFGGSFNPVHNGHIKLLQEAEKSFRFDKTLVIPTKIPPHKKPVDFASDVDRLNMCRIAFSDNKNAEVCDYEINSDAISYTINTLNHFKEAYPDDEFYFLMGSDMLLTFDQWKQYKEILSMTSIIAASRELSICDEMQTKKAELENLGGKIYILATEPYIVSSSSIRAMIKCQKDFSCYLPQRVVKYIMDKNLYME